MINRRWSLVDDGIHAKKVCGKVVEIAVQKAEGHCHWQMEVLLHFLGLRLFRLSPARPRIMQERSRAPSHHHIEGSLCLFELGKIFARTFQKVKQIRFGPQISSFSMMGEHAQTSVASTEED